MIKSIQFSLKGLFIVGRWFGLFVFLLSASSGLAQQTAKKDVNGRGYLEYLPPGYNDNSDIYPVIIFLHGQGERGIGSPSALEKVKKHGPPKHINNGHNMCFEYNGVEECFVVLSPQTNSYNWWAPDVMQFIETAAENYRIDPSRICLMGISMGGQGVWRVAYSEENTNNIFAALSVAPGKGEFLDACKVAEDKTAVWAFHGTNDNSSMKLPAGERPINGMIACGADPAPIFTVYEGVGHNSWDKAYRTDNSLHTPNIYQWFLAQRLSDAAPKAPTVNAGIDLEVTLPLSEVEIKSIANDSDGEIVNILWERVSGPSTPIIAVNNELTLLLTGLIEGTYTYRISVTDNDGNVSSDQVIIVVNPEPANVPPAVNAGSNKTITLPQSTLSLTGTASDTDGSIFSVLWEQVSGPNSATIVSSSTLSPSISGLVEGNYVFSLVATDDSDAKNSDNINVTVNPEPSNTPPTANAGVDIELTLPDNSVTITGSGTDSDGSIAMYLWEQSSGPNTATTSKLSSAELTISALIQGSYLFVLNVADDDGDIDSDQVIINVSPPPPNDPPISDAGLDITITLPENSVSLVGKGTDSDGTVSSYSWSQLSGPSTAILSSSNQMNTSASDLAEGNYVFSLLVTDNDGDTDADNIQISVLPIPVNEPPTVSAGEDLFITLPVSNISLVAIADDIDGSIVSLRWEQNSGPSTAAIGSPSSASTTINDLQEGAYQFTITVLDDGGNEASDQIIVTVFPVQNKSPASDAGSDISITLPQDSTTLSGIGTDSDGVIANYLWFQITGPSTAVIANVNEAETAVTELIVGVYTFRLTVTDDGGLTDSDQIALTVLPQPANIPPTANAGNDVYLTLPENSVTLLGQGSDSDGSIVSFAWGVDEIGNVSIDEIDNLEVQNLAISGLETGTYTFDLTVKDDRGASASDQVTVFVDTPDLPPVASAGEDLSITLPQNSVNLSGSVSDPDGEITFSLWEQLDGPNRATISNSLNLDTEVSNLIEGIYVFNLFVLDNDDLSGSGEIRVTVNPKVINAPPDVSAGADIEFTLPIDELLIIGTATDIEGTVFSEKWLQIDGPNTLTVINEDASSATYSGFVLGVYTMRFSAIDKDNAEGSDDMKITVLSYPGNQLPTVDAGNNLEVEAPISETQLFGNAFDVDGIISTYLWTQVSGPNMAEILSSSENSTGLKNLIVGVYTFKFTVADNRGGEAFDQVNIRVNPPPANEPPTILIESNKVIRLPQSSVTLIATASDSDGEIINILWSQISGPSAATLADSETLNLSLTNLIKGTYIFKVEVTDDDGITDFDEANIKVLEEFANQPPLVNLGENKTIVFPTNSVSFNGEVEDLDGTITSLNWTQISGPSLATIADAISEQTVIDDLQIGSYVFKLEATDNNGLKGFDEVSVRVDPEAPNLPPTASTAENVILTLPENEVTLIGEGTDVDGTIENLSWSQQFGPEPATLININESEVLISELVGGFYIFRLTVTDDDGAVDFVDVSVTVNNAIPILPPVVNAGEDLTIILPDESVSLSGSATNEDGTIEKIVWEQLSGPSEIEISFADVFETEVSGFQEGTYIFRLVVENSVGLQNFDLVSVNAKANLVPFAFAGNDTTLTYPVDNFETYAQGLDNDGFVERVEWVQLTGPSDALIVDPSASKTTINNLELGGYQFQFSVVDNKGGETLDILNVVVATYDGNVAPIVNVGGDITIQLPQNSIELSSFVEDPDGEIVNYEWSLLEGGQIVISTPDEESTLIEGLELGNYVLQLAVTDNGGLQSQDIMNIMVIEAEPEEPSLLTINLTKLFTPNGDGVNDLWVSDELNDKNGCAIKIFNALGVKVFEDNDYNNDWDGRDINGQALDEGVYYYTLSCDNSFTINGGLRLKK
jgi:gliding motility-associated-like protein